MKRGITVNITTEAIIRAIALVFAAVIVMKFIGNISYQLQLIGISFFLALALNPAVSQLSKQFRLKNRILATGLAYLIVIIALGLFMYIVVPPLVNQSVKFVKSLPTTVNDLQNETSPVGRIVQRYNLQDQVKEIGHSLSARVSDIPSTVFDIAGRVGGVVISVLTILVLTFMMLVEGPRWMELFWSFTPEAKRKDYKALVHKMYRVVTGYINGQVFIAFVAATFAMIALIIATHILHVSINAVAMAGIVFLFGLIPLIGNTLAAIVVVIACLFVSLPLAIIMAVYFPVYQQIENATLTPHIQSKGTQLTPLLVFIAALIGAGFGGLLGAFIAIPVAGCIRVLLEYKIGEEVAPSTKSNKTEE